MRLAIMQPYLFPYVGYFQLLVAADKFVIYDDVAFIKQGWINRNNILANGASCRFSVPLRGASSFSSIHATKIDGNQYGAWKRRFYKTLTFNYRKAPQFAETMSVVTPVFDGAAESMGDLAAASVRAVARYLELPAQIVDSSRIYDNSGLKSAERVRDICAREGATDYINVQSGEALYSRADFAAQGLRLRFIKPRARTYAQFGAAFVPWLSIIDLLMFNDPAQARALLEEYDLT